MLARGHVTTCFRLEWPKEHYFPPCVLTFRDGWEPPSLTWSQEPSQLTDGVGRVQRGAEPAARPPEVSGLGFPHPAPLLFAGSGL